MSDERLRNNKVKSVNNITQDEHDDNLDAKRVTLVDGDGNSGLGLTSDNPIFVRLSDGSISIGTVNAELEVQLSHKDNDPNSGDVADSVRIGNGEFEANVNEDGSFDVNMLNKLINKPHDDVETMSKNDDGNPTVVEFRNLGSLVFTINITYDADGDFKRARRVDA